MQEYLTKDGCVDRSKETFDHLPSLTLLLHVWNDPISIIPSV